MRPTRRMAAAVLLGVAAAGAVGAEGGGLAGLAAPHSGRSMRATSSFRRGPDGRYLRAAEVLGNRDEQSNWDNFRVAPGETHVLMDEKGPGVITHIWLTFLGPEPQDWAPQGSATHQDMLLRITWDGRDRPGVEAPVGDFFANCFGRRNEVVSLPVTVEDGDSYNCFWHMPFRKSARVEIVNQGDRPVNLLYYNIDWIKKDRLPADMPYFHAQYRQEYPVRSGEDYVVLETRGRGHYVGTVLAVRTRSPSWFGEGDEKIWIDGEEKPSIWGTGTEDYFLSAWGLKRTATPFAGVPYFDQWGIVGGHTSAYRWHVADPIVFRKGIRVAFEHWGWISPDENPNRRSTSWNERQDDYASVAYWYQTGEPTFRARAPGGAERRLPSLERTIAYARDLTADRYHGTGRMVRQQLALYPGPQALYMPQQQNGAWVEVPFKVERKEPLRLLLRMTRSYDFGRYRVLLNGVQIGGELDFYSPEVVDQEYHLLDFWPEPGDYTLRLECAGKNPQSAGHYLGMESLRLRERRPRVAEYGHEREIDWRQTRILHR